MKELDYPFDASVIVSKHKAFRRRLLESGAAFMQKRVAILGGYTTRNIKNAMELFLLNNGIKAEFYESEYNQYFNEASFPNEALKAFRPDVIYLCTGWRNIKVRPEVTDSTQSIEQLLQAEAAGYISMWQNIKEKYNCPILQNNFEYPPCRLLGNKDASDVHGGVNFVSRLNAAFYEYAQKHDDFYIVDVNYISASYGLNKWYNPADWFMYKYAVSTDAMPTLAFNAANVIKSLFGKNKKGLVLDLDNTLWGGVIGDDGVEGIAIGRESAEGEAFADFQAYIKRLESLGVVLAIDSKNDKENAVKGLSHPDSVLHLDDFAVVKANWEAKSKNFLDIAGELNLLPESLVFLDDNPAEREIVCQQFPEVKAPPLSDAARYIELLDGAGYFEATAISSDDVNRARMYQDNAKRAQLLSAFRDYGEYLDSLEMRARIVHFESIAVPRIVQLANKSNQFNLTTRRYTQPEIEAIANSNDYITLYGRLCDKFGDNGIVSVVIGRVAGDACHIELWLMSCRVLKRGMENAMMDCLVKSAKERGIKEIMGYYIPTAKNAMVKDFYKDMGFDAMGAGAGEDGSTSWRLEAEQYKEGNKHILMEA